MSFREEVMNHGAIWGYAYGKYLPEDGPREKQILEIKTESLLWPEDGVRFYEPIAWDSSRIYAGNMFYQKDYGQTWAYTKEELL